MKRMLFSFLLTGAVLSAGTVNVSVSNLGSPAEQDSRGYDVGPYTLIVNGATLQAMSVDDQDWMSTNWKANLTSLNSSNFYGDAYHPLELQEYKEDAWILTQILKGNDRVDLQDAAWDIIDYSITSVSQLNSLGIKSGTNLYKDISDAICDYSTLNFAYFDLLSAVGPDGCYRPQEFLICNTPEPSSFALLGVALLLAGAFRLRTRKQTCAVHAG